MKITPEQVIEASQITNSATQAAKLLGIKIDTYRKHAIALGCYKTNQSGKGISKKGNRKRENFLNERYFNIIDSNLKAYFLGFIAADGTVNRHRLVVNISKKDREILKVFCEEIGYDACHIQDYQTYYYDADRNKHCFDASRLIISSSQMVNDLKKYNIVQNKSHIDNNLAEYVPKEFMNSWITGYIDGDGHISKNSFSISLVSNNQTVKFIGEYLSELLNISPNFHQIGEITYELSYRKKHETIRLCLLYYFSSSYHLSRKLDSANNIISHYLSGGFSFAGQRKESSNKCPDCGKMISARAKRCRSCSGRLKAKNLSTRKGSTIQRPQRDTLKALIRNHSFLYLGKLFGVSDNAIRKWCKAYELPYKAKDIKALTDKEWDAL